jgi:hypothetical protein
MTNKSDRFDRNFYVKAYKDVNPRFVNPVTHYNTVGKTHDRLPNADKFRHLYPLFDELIYVTNNPDLKTFTLEELMCHFHHYGRFECRIYRKNQTKYI